MAIKTQKIVADFETTTTPGDVRVWAVCAVDIDSIETVHIGNNIDGFMTWLSTRNTVCYFHNLKFDGEFILYYLLTHGFKYSDSHAANTFETLITDDGIFYSITVYFSKKNKKYQKVTFYDSLKKLPFKVSVISKAFELEDQKLVIDYDAPRPEGHQLTEEEKAYIVNDCRIVAQALKIQFAQGLKKMTNASDAMNGYKEIISKDRFERWFPVLPVELDADLRRAYKGGFTWLKPHHRNAEGIAGICFDVNSLYPWAMASCLLPFGYPMFFEGKPEPDDKYPLFIVRIACEFELKKDHIPTVQLKNNRAFIETEYLSSSNGEIVEMTLTNVDLQLLLDHYDVYNLEYISGWKFKGVVGMFKDYIDHWMHIKETTTGALRQLAKLMLNSLYGKFATNPKAYKKVPYFDSDSGVVRYEVINSVDAAKRMGVEAPELRDPVYTAMGAFITAYAREKTIRSAQSVYHRFVYADTDSLHLIGWDVPEGLEVHPTHLGAWKNEGRFSYSKYLRAKTYMETMMERKASSLKNYCRMMCEGFDIHRDRKEIVVHDTLENYCRLLNRSTDIIREEGEIFYLNTKVTCAGMPDNVKESVTYDNFHSGSTFDGKLMPRRYPGGIVLENTTFTIK